MVLTELSENTLHNFRLEWNQLSSQDHIDPPDLSFLQRIFLQTDGTLTEMLEVYLSETIHVHKLSEGTRSTIPDIPSLDLRSGSEIIERKILLRGTISRKNWLYAESVIVPDRLEMNFRKELITSGKPIGKLWRKYKVETYKEIISCFYEPADALADYFEIKRSDYLLCRIYRVISNRKPIMMITEKFPASYYI